MTDECPVCVSPYTKRRLKINCPNHCGFSCCSECFSNYLNSTNQTETNCMSCKYDYTEDDLVRVGMKQFILKNNRRIANIIIEKSSHLKPLLVVKAEKMAEAKIVADRVRENKAIAKLKAVQLRNLKYNIYEDERRRDKLYGYDISSILYNTKCPDVKCSGVAEDDNKCSKCRVLICVKCHKQSFASHICNEDDLLTSKYLQDNSVPCPQCDTRISRVDGCKDMYCVNCCCKFNYETGEKIHREIHNPHIPKTSNQSLDDCRPVGNPPYQLYSVEHNHPYKSYVSSIASFYYAINEEATHIAEYNTEKNIRRRRNSIMASHIAYNQTDTALRRNLMDDFKRVEHGKQTLPMWQFLHATLLDIMWHFVEGKSEDEAVLLDVNNKMRQSIQHTADIIDWFETEMMKNSKNIAKLKKMDLGYIHRILFHIPKQYFEYKHPELK